MSLINTIANNSNTQNLVNPEQTQSILENIRNVMKKVVEQSNLGDKEFSKSFVDFAEKLGAGKEELAELTKNFEELTKNVEGLDGITKDSDKIQELATQLKEVSTKLGEVGDAKSLAIAGVALGSIVLAGVLASIIYKAVKHGKEDPSPNLNESTHEQPLNQNKVNSI